MTTQAIEGGKAKRKAAKQAKTDAVARAKALAPDLAVRIGSTPKTKFRGDPGAFGRLVEEHAKHRGLLGMIEETAGKSPARTRVFEAYVQKSQEGRQGGGMGKGGAVWFDTWGR